MLKNDKAPVFPVWSVNFLLSRRIVDSSAMVVQAGIVMSKLHLSCQSEKKLVLTFFFSNLVSSGMLEVGCFFTLFKVNTVLQYVR